MKTIILPGKTFMRKLCVFLFFSCLLHALRGLGAEVSPEKAETVASQFLSAQLSSSNSKVQTASLQLAYVKRLPGAAGARQTAKPLYYVFNNGGNGWVIISGDDAAYPVLGFSDHGAFDPTHLPEAYQKWVANYENQIREIIKSGASPNTKVAKAWKEARSQQTNTVGPLLTSQWNQLPYYNDLCPRDPDTGEHAVTGCVATALAQILKYYEYPAKGTGFHAYQHDTYGTISADFGLTTYAWDQMPDAPLNGPNEAIALLSFHCGVAVDMNYGTESSGAAGAVLVQPALQNYFDYNADIAARADYSEAAWVSLLQAEFDAGRPVYYEGFGNGSGHAFVCDGYQDDQYFHFNWGWGGMMDGFYYINDLSPTDLGTGGGNGSYNSNQKIVYHIQPRGDNGGGGGTPAGGLELYSEIQADPNPVYFANPFTVTVSVANLGEAPFTGMVAAVITNFDNLTEVLDSVSVTMDPQYYYNFSIPTEGLPIANPGTYSIAIFSKAEGEAWKQVTSDTYASTADIEILGPDNPLELSQELTVGAEHITQNEPFDVSFNIVNQGDQEFGGTLYAALYDLDGYFKTLVDSVTVPSLPGGYTFTENVVMHATGTDLAPGSYLLALVSGGATDTLLVAGGQYLNPVTVIVQAPPLAGDPYENNDTEDAAYVLDATMNGDQLTIKTEGANQHTDLDYDYYKINLPAGGNYTISARVQDSFDSQDGQEYTNDVMFSYKTNSSDWSESFDTALPDTISASGGSSVMFWIAPYFAGQQGTYALEIQISRSDNAGQTISLISPLKGTSWDESTAQPITWESNFTGKVTLELYRNHQYLASLAKEIDNTGSYTWTLPDTLPQGADYQIMIYSVEDNKVQAISEFFSIDRVTGVADELASEVRCYPNPVQDQLSLAFTDKRPEALQVYSAQGVFLTNVAVEGPEVFVDMQQFPAGLYLIHCVWAEGWQTVHKIIKR